MNTASHLVHMAPRNAPRGRSIHDSPTAGCHGDRVLLVDEHELMAMGLQSALAGCGYLVETSTGPTAGDVVLHAQRFEPRCVLLDTRVGHDVGSGIDLIAPLVATGAQVVMLTSERRSLVLAECLEAGAAGWINKKSTLSELDATVGRLLSGGTVIGQTIRLAMLDELRRDREREMRVGEIFDGLTEREAVVLSALAAGLTAEQIAGEHYVSLATIRSQIRAVLRKLDVRSQLAAVAIAADHRHLLPPRGSCDPMRRRAHDRDHRAATPAASIA